MPEFDATIRYALIAGFPDYCVGSDGSVLDKWGHVFVTLRPGTVHRTVHRLMLEAFVGPRPAGQECCHQDGNPKNNAIGNLRWDTSSANRLDTVCHGRHPGGWHCLWRTRKPKPCCGSKGPRHLKDCLINKAKAESNGETD